MGPSGFDAVIAAMETAKKPAHHAAKKHEDAKHDKKGIDFHGGFLDTHGHGRTDDIPLNIPTGSYVLPADIVSALGQGNTLAGAKAVQEILSDAPYNAQGAGAYGSAIRPNARGAGVPAPHIPPAPPVDQALLDDTSVAVPPVRKEGGAVKILRAAGLMVVTAEEPRKILFIKRDARGGDHHGEWAFPGGGIEPTETPEEAARREAHEELGIYLSHRVDMWTRRRCDGVDFITFKLEVPRAFRPKLNHEHSDYLWRPADRPPSPLHPGCHIALDKLIGWRDGREEGGRVGLIPIIAAGGEYVIAPHEAKWLGNGELTKGHDWLDKFVVETRKELRKTLGKLKGPKKSDE